MGGIRLGHVPAVRCPTADRDRSLVGVIMTGDDVLSVGYVAGQGHGGLTTGDLHSDLIRHSRHYNRP